MRNKTKLKKEQGQNNIFIIDKERLSENIAY